MSRRSRLLLVHPETNQQKLDGLDKLYQEYLAYLAVCCQFLVESKTLKPSRTQYRACPPASVLSSGIEEACREHSGQIVASWAAAVYERAIKRKVGVEKRAGRISDEQAHRLYQVGKYGVSVPNKRVGQPDIDLYWEFVAQHGGAKPSISSRTGMMLTGSSAKLRGRRLNLTEWWLDLSSLVKGVRIRIPLAPNPRLKTFEEAADGMKIWKNRRGQWCLQVVECQEYLDPRVDESAPRVGVDVGLNCLAATSDGNLYGRGTQAWYRPQVEGINRVRANRQRQGLPKNSHRLDRMEERLSGRIKTQCGRIANLLVAQYQGHSFVIENLHLEGTHGSKRFHYKGVHGALVGKAPCIIVNPAYTSQQCPSCGAVDRRNRSGTKFKCRSCGRVSHADLVGGFNLLRRSEDPEIQPEDSPARVRTLLEARYRHRRSSATGDGVELAASNRRLTVGAPDGPRIASNAQREISTKLFYGKS
jgi:transposase